MKDCQGKERGGRSTSGAFTGKNRTKRLVRSRGGAPHQEEREEKRKGSGGEKRGRGGGRFGVSWV